MANKISSLINVRTIFRDNAASSIRLITEAKQVLERWDSSYMQMRQKIEDSGRDNRWKLPPATSHIYHMHMSTSMHMNMHIQHAHAHVQVGV